MKRVKFGKFYSLDFLSMKSWKGANKIATKNTSARVN